MGSSTHKRGSAGAWAPLLSAAALAAAALLGGGVPAAAAGPSPGSTATPAVASSLTSAPVLGDAPVSDWDHILQVVAWHRQHLPPRRVVYYFGGSAMRESIVSESAWSAQTRRLLGRSVTTYVLASTCQTFAEDQAIANQLPKDRGVVLVGVGLGRFTTTHKARAVPGDSTRSSPPGPWSQHVYDDQPPFSAAQKRTQVHDWLADRYSVFSSRYEKKLTELEDLIKACQARGLRVALVEMPADLPVIGHRFDKARRKYQPACARLAGKYGIAYLRFVGKIGLRDRDFFDIAHLLPSGRAKWQRRLSHELVWKKLLKPAAKASAAPQE